MCICHKYNNETKQIERVKGVFSLNTGNDGDIFQFEHEDFKRQIVKMNFRAKECFAPPIEKYSGLDERGLHTFHLSFKAKF
jgi:hypothetical protein